MKKPTLTPGSSFGLAALLLAAAAPAPQSTQAGAAGSQRPLKPVAQTALSCVQSIVDQNGGPCLEASSTPTAGMLFPPPHDGGVGNSASGTRAFIGGGQSNSAAGPFSTVGGGTLNDAAGDSSCVAGGSENSASAYGATVAGGIGNVADGGSASIGGGNTNLAPSYFATVGGGQGNAAMDLLSTVGGGRYNTASGEYATVGGGAYSTASGDSSTVAGGMFNYALSSGATVGGGSGNSVSAGSATIAGGSNNDIGSSAVGAAIPGGVGNEVAPSASYAFAAGRRARANHAGAFVWGDSNNADKPSSAADQFNVYAAGGTRIFSDSGATTGVLLAPGGGSWTAVSDRKAKENFEAVDGLEVLERLAAVPITTWNYRTQDDSVRHMGPMAQDFYAAFGLGLGERSIDSVDPDGVALAAIQALNAKHEQARAELAELAELLRDRDRELASLRRELEALRARVE